jgi:hypothetical protein
VIIGALVTVEPARIPKVQAAPNPEGGGSTTQGAEVVKLHVKLAASALPKVSMAPVVIVAVNLVLGVRLAAGGVKVATLVDES